MLWTRSVIAALALLLTLMPALAQSLTIEGTVTYRERIALPAHARLEVSLVRLPGMVPVVGASTDIPATGGIPMAFTLNIRDVDPGMGPALGLLAKISSGGRVLFRSAQPVRVDLAAGAKVDLLVHYAPDPRPRLGEKLAAPDEPLPAPTPAVSTSLHDVVWTLTSIGGKPVTGDRPLTLAIASDNRAGGSGGCNEYFAEAMVDGSALSFGPAAATRMACAESVMTQEADYFAALAAIAAYELDGNSLRLLDAAGIPLIGLVRKEH
jgi:putative lipoprotein